MTPSGPDVHRMLVHEHAAAGDGFDDRDVVALREGGELRGSQRIVDAAAGDDQRLLRLRERSGGRLHLGVGARRGDAVQRRLEECGRIVEGLALDVLRQPDEGRPAVGGIEHGRDRLRQRLQDLLGPHDAVPVARHRLEGIVDGDGRIARSARPAAAPDRGSGWRRCRRQEEHRQPVRVRDGGGRDHVGGARADRAGGDHDLPALPGLGEADRGERHRLLVLAAPGRQPILDRFERLGQGR